MLMALCCDRNGCIYYIVVEVDSRRIIERVIGHEVSNEIDDWAYQTGGCLAGDCLKLYMSDTGSCSDQGTGA